MTVVALASRVTRGDRSDGLHGGMTMDTGTRLDQIAAVSRLLSGAYSDDAVLIRTMEPEDVDNGKRRRYRTVLAHMRGEKVLPLSEIHASVTVERVGHSYPPPSWPERVDALHVAAMDAVSRVATKAAELVAAGKVQP